MTLTPATGNVWKLPHGLADRGFGKPAAVRDDDLPGIGDFTIVINDHQDDGNSMVEA